MTLQVGQSTWKELLPVLSRAGGHVNNAFTSTPHPGEISQPLESSCSSPTFCIQYLICCTESGLVKKQLLCRLYESGSFGKLVGAGQVLPAGQVLIAPGALACWAGAAPGRETRYVW